MPAEATILHADLDSFYASVERRDNPALANRPVIVGAGVVLAATYDAKAKGVRTAMNGAEARRLCPEAVVVPPRMSAYTEASRAVFEIFEDTSPSVEGLSIDEAFLDVRGLEQIKGTPHEIATKLRRDIHEQVGLPITVGVANTKFLAKVVSAFAKPDGLLIVSPEDSIDFLHPLEVERLWGVGKVTSKKLRERGVRTVGDIATRGEDALTLILGPSAGKHLFALSQNQDPRRVKKRARRRSIGAQHALGRGRHSQHELDTILVGLVERLARRLRAAGRSGRTVVLRLRFADFAKATRSRTLNSATTQTETILATARELLAATRQEIESRGITLIGVAVANLDDGAQLSLQFDGAGATELDTAVDDIRNRFGSDAIKRAVLLERDERFSTPQLPD
ncbi:MAG: DNA polymerase IV [Solirubrobacterales bacterium]